MIDPTSRSVPTPPPSTQFAKPIEGNAKHDVQPDPKANQKLDDARKKLLEDSFEHAPDQEKELNFDDPKVVAQLSKSLGVDAAKLSKRGEDDTKFDGALVGKDGTIPMDQIGDKKLKDVPGFTPSNGSRPKETIIQVNGIATTEAAQRGVLQDVADKTGAKVVGVHNATEGLITDLKQCVGDKTNLGKNKAVDSLKNVILKELDSGQDVHIMAHSQGGLITSRALNAVKDELEKNGQHNKLGKIKVETFGAASGRYPDGPKYVHYINTKDPVPGWFGVKGTTSFFNHPGMDINGNQAVIREFSKGSKLRPLDAHDFKDSYLPERKPFDRVFHPSNERPTNPRLPVPTEPPPTYPFQPPSLIPPDYRPSPPRGPSQIPLGPRPSPGFRPGGFRPNGFRGFNIQG